MGVMRRTALAATLALLTTLALVGSPAIATPQFGEWSAPVNLGPVVNSPGFEFGPAITPDGLSLYFNNIGPNEDIWVSHRDRKDAPWGPPVNLTVINTSFGERVPAFSRNGRMMFFSSDRAGGSGGRDIWVATRANPHDDFGWQTPVNLGPNVNSTFDDAGPALLEPEEDVEGAILFFNSTRAGTLDLYTSVRGPDGSFGPATPVAELNTPFAEARSTVRRDGLEIFFHSDRPGGQGASDMWTSTRAAIADRWSPPVNLGLGVNSSDIEFNPYLSKDGRTLFFISTRPGGSGLGDIYMVTRDKGGQAD